MADQRSLRRGKVSQEWKEGSAREFLGLSWWEHIQVELRVRTELWAWLALNLLNVADLLLTRHILASGIGDEANPVAGWLGPLGKLALVAACSTVLLRLRPGVLKWLAGVYGVVVIYSVAGVVRNPTA